MAQHPLDAAPVQPVKKYAQETVAEELPNTKKKGVALNISWERTKQAYFDAYEHANKLSNSGQPDFNVLRELCTGHIYNDQKRIKGQIHLNHSDLLGRY
jgi:hypothetical protein